MDCAKYQSLSYFEKRQMIGSVIIAIQTSDSCFEMAEQLLQLAALEGITTTLQTESEIVRDVDKDLNQPIERGLQNY